MYSTYIIVYSNHARLSLSLYQGVFIIFYNFFFYQARELRRDLSNRRLYEHGI